MEPHGINADLTYEIIDSNILKSETIKSKLEGYINFENLKTGKKAILPFRSFVDGFLQTIHGILSGDRGADTRLQSVSQAALTTTASAGILLSTDTLAPSITDTSIDSTILHASVNYNAHTYEPPSYSGYTSKFAFSRVIANNKATAIYPEQIGIKTRGIAVTVGVPSASSASRVISKDLNALTIASDESVRITFTFEAVMDAIKGGVVLNFAKLIYNSLIKGNLNHTSSKIVSVTGTTPTYVIASSNNGLGSVAATLGSLFIGSTGTGYIGIVLQPWEKELDPLTPGEYVIAPDHTGLTPSVNTVSAIEYTTISNGANFSITRTFTNTGTTTKKIGRIGLLTRGTAANVTGATVNANQVLLMLNAPSDTLEVAPNQILKVTYNFGIQV